MTYMRVSCWWENVLEEGNQNKGKDIQVSSLTLKSRNVPSKGHCNNCDTARNKVLYKKPRVFSE